MCTKLQFRLAVKTKLWTGVAGACLEKPPLLLIVTAQLNLNWSWCLT